jgi:hypothetical protein
MRANRQNCVALVVLACALFLPSSSVTSQALDGVPHLISYQGRLTDAGSNPVSDGEYLVTFTIWDDSLSTAPTNRKWISPDCPVLAVNGLFNWQLGSRENLPPWTIANSTDLWLGIQVESDAEIAPRTRLCSAPYAYKAWQADYAEYADSAGVVVTSIGESGAYDGIVNTDMVETDPGGATTVDFASAFTSIGEPHMCIAVVLKQAANGLVEGTALRAAVDVKGTAGNWTGFDITVSKYSDGSSISDATEVFVTWMAMAR